MVERYPITTEKTAALGWSGINSAPVDLEITTPLRIASPTRILGCGPEQAVMDQFFQNGRIRNEGIIKCPIVGAPVADSGQTFGRFLAKIASFLPAFPGFCPLW